MNAVAVMHDPGIEAREPGQHHQRRAGEVEDAREQRHARNLGDEKNGAADYPVPGGDGVQAEEFGRDQREAGQQEGKECPTRAQRGDAALDGVNRAHRTQPGHQRSGPVPDEFLDQEHDGGQPYEGGEQQALKFLQQGVHKGVVLPVVSGSNRMSEKTAMAIFD